MRVARFRTSPQTRAGLAWKRPLFRWSVILALVSAFPWILPGGPSRRDLVFIANLITVACAVVVGDQVLSVERGRGRVRFWEGAIGRTLFRVAGLGVRRTSRGAVTVDQRTEVAICFSALALFDRLPKETRNGLGDVRSTLERLERDAGALRLRQREVKRLLLDSADDVVGARLSTTEQSLGRKYADVITALEGIRLGLLRLHAGVASPEGLTTDLGIAADLGTRLGQLSRAQQEVDELLV
jgi:hypothetical protein